MDTSPTPRTVRLLVEITRTRDARLEGQLRPDATGPWTAFSGVLELLKAIEETLDLATSDTTSTQKRTEP
jgi:hypothetical protein